MIIFANPSTRPHKATPKKPAKRHRSAVSKGASAMAKRHRSPAQRAATKRMLAANRSRKRHHNPAPRKARSRRRYSNPAPRHHARRRVHRNPSIASARSFLGELASTQGLIMLASAAAAPTVVDMAAGYIVPVQYQTGYTGLLAKLVIAGGIAYALDRFGKQRKAAIGFAVGAAGSLIATAVKTYQVSSVIPTVTPAVQDQIAENPAMYKALMENASGSNYDSLNGYVAAPMSGYESAPLGDEFDSLN
jgi:hypothetical protein